MGEWQPIETAPKNGSWFVARNQAQFGVAVYPCVFDLTRELWVGPVDLHLVHGLFPEEWKPLDGAET